MFLCVCVCVPVRSRVVCCCYAVGVLCRECEDVYGAHVKKRRAPQPAPAPPSRAQQEQRARQQRARAKDGLDRRHCTSLMFQRAAQFIANCTSSTSHNGTSSEGSSSSSSAVPFLLYLSPLSPHPPFIYPPAYDRVFDSLPAPIGATRRKVLWCSLSASSSVHDDQLR